MLELENNSMAWKAAEVHSKLLWYYYHLPVWRVSMGFWMCTKQPKWMDVSIFSLEIGVSWGDTTSFPYWS
jgi:hypothetical protein